MNNELEQYEQLIFGTCRRVERGRADWRRRGCVFTVRLRAGIDLSLGERRCLPPVPGLGRCAASYRELTN